MGLFSLLIRLRWCKVLVCFLFCVYSGFFQSKHFVWLKRVFFDTQACYIVLYKRTEFLSTRKWNHRFSKHKSNRYDFKLITIKNCRIFEIHQQWLDCTVQWCQMPGETRLYADSIFCTCNHRIMKKTIKNENLMSSLNTNIYDYKLKCSMTFWIPYRILVRQAYRDCW